VAALLLLIGSGCGREKEEVLARVNQRPITQRQLWLQLEKADNGQAGMLALDELILRQLVRQEADKRGVGVNEEELDERVTSFKDRVLVQTGKDFGRWLEETGQSEDDVKSNISFNLLLTKLVLLPQDREAFFEEAKDQLEGLPGNSESAILRQIVVASKEEADAIYQELTAGDTGEDDGPDFFKIAEERSMDPMTRYRGGMVGWLVKGKSADPALEEIAFALTPGEISKPQPIPIPESVAAQAEEIGEAAPERWRIVKLEKIVPPRELTLEANAENIENMMLGDPRYQLQVQDFLDGLRAGAEIEVLAPRYRALGEAYERSREARQLRQRARQQPLPPAPTAEEDAPEAVPGDE
jgi:hypothetical protein